MSLNLFVCYVFTHSVGVRMWTCRPRQKNPVRTCTRSNALTPETQPPTRGPSLFAACTHTCKCTHTHTVILTIDVCVQDIHKLGIRGIQSVLGQSSSKQRASRIQCCKHHKQYQTLINQHANKAVHSIYAFRLTQFVEWSNFHEFYNGKLRKKAIYFSIWLQCLHLKAIGKKKFSAAAQ